jgi:hypothetical protein
MRGDNETKVDCRQSLGWGWLLVSILSPEAAVLKQNLCTVNIVANAKTLKADPILALVPFDIPKLLDGVEP